MCVCCWVHGVALSMAGIVNYGCTVSVCVCTTVYCWCYIVLCGYVEHVREVCVRRCVLVVEAVWKMEVRSTNTELYRCTKFV